MMRVPCSRQGWMRRRPSSVIRLSSRQRRTTLAKAERQPARRKPPRGIGSRKLPLLLRRLPSISPKNYAKLTAAACRTRSAAVDKWPFCLTTCSPLSVGRPAHTHMHDAPHLTSS